MQRSLFLLATAAASVSVFAAPPEPKFRAATLDDKVQIGYGVAVADVDGDGKPDVLLADKKQFVWYQNPGGDVGAKPWPKYVLAENLTEKDNVCIAAQDIDGDGKCEIAVGAEWNPTDTDKSGAVFYLIPPADRTQKWEAVKFPSVEPTTHRMKWVQIRDLQWGLLVAPLHGRGNKNGEGAPVKVLLYHKPNDPHAEWKSEVVNESLHMTHNFFAAGMGSSGPEIYLAGREGVLRIRQELDGTWFNEKVIHSEQADFKGAGEVRIGMSGNAGPEKSFVFAATVEPMHGNALYMTKLATQSASRLALKSDLVEGHALAVADLLQDGDPQILVGWRGNPQKPHPVGIKLFTQLDEKGEKWRESFIDDDGMACEDLTVADLNGDGKLDVVASGRATKNLKIYLNETPR